MATLLCLLLVLFGLLPVNAVNTNGSEGANIQVKAGIFYFDGYHMEDGDGGYTGYGIEFLNLVSQYSHLNFSLVGYDYSWGDMLGMLDQGEIDVVTSARKTPEREEKYAFSLPIGRNSTVLSIQADNTTRLSGNYATYNGITIGIVPGSSQNQALAEFALDKGFSYQTKEYPDTAQMAEDLQNGTIDAILSSNLRKAENEKTLDTIETDYFYAIVRKEDTELLSEINYAIDQMDLNEGDWSNVLYYKYYGNSAPTTLSFTPREQAYIQDVAAGRKHITVTSMSDRKPYSYVEDGELKGILPDYFAALMEMAELPYETVLPSDRAEYYTLAADDGVDVVIDWREDQLKDEKLGQKGFCTTPYLNTGVALVTRKDFNGEIKTLAVADLLGDIAIEEGLSGNAKILNCQTRENALQAVSDGRADATYVYTYTAQSYVNNDSSSSLQYSMANSLHVDFQMYVRSSCDHELITILNKCIGQIPDDTMRQLVTAYTANTPENMSFAQYLRAHPEIIAISALAAAVAMGVIIALFLRSKWNKKLLHTTELANQALESQLAIVNTLSRDFLNVYAVNARTNAVKVVKLTGYVAPGLEPTSPKEISYSELLFNYIHNRVFSEDREYLTQALTLDTVIEKLGDSTEYSGSYRVLIDDELHTFQFTCATYLESDGSYRDPEEFFLVGFRNIDEIVRRDQEQKAALETALAQAQHANHAKTTFLNNMSHDIRTPMNAIIGFTSLAATHIDSQDTVRNYLSKIMTSSKHLLNLINDVLDMSRIESGKVTINEEEVSLPEIMHDLKTIVQADIKAKQLEFYIDTLDVTDEIIICDKLRLNQVLLNILSNAMKYTKAGGTVSVRIIQTAADPEGYAAYQFRVKDTGIGMSKEFLEHVFEPFEREQTATVSGIQGTGLGLAITKNIIDMMNGTVEVESEVGKGTEFIVSFQFRTGSQPQGVAHLDKLAHQRALIVDDDVNTCMSVSKMLSSIGMNPDWTTQGKEAVIHAKFAIEENKPYSTYIIDWLMPDMNGVEVVRRIRKVIGDTATIIILTAYDWADIEEDAKEAGVTAFCSKPIFLSELRQILVAPYMESAAEAGETQETLLKGKRILLVEDNEINQEIAQEILKDAGLLVDTVGDGTEAVDTIKTVAAGTYDLILMDVQMPIMDGYEATRQIRALEDTARASVPIVAMTANAFEEDKQKAIDAGMNAHVAKPIDIFKLMETLREILGD